MTDYKQKSLSMVRQVVGTSHHEFVFKRRIHKLANVIAEYLQAGSVLDVGCGNGMLGALLMSKRSDVNIIGIDVHLRRQNFIPSIQYDGTSIPFKSNAFASVMVIDVLHHTDNPEQILRECLRVSQGTVVIKDHFYTNPVEWGILRMMDWVGNAPHGVRLPYNYFTREHWSLMLNRVDATELHRQECIPQLYPVPFQWLIGCHIQFIAQIQKSVVQVHT